MDLDKIRKKHYKKRYEYCDEDTIGYILLQKYPDLIATHQFSKYDRWSAAIKAILELKSRTQHHTTLLIEKVKYDALMGFKEADNAYYINFTPEMLLQWDLKAIPEPEWKYELHNTSTKYINHVAVTTCWKWVGYLPIYQATDLTYLLDAYFENRMIDEMWWDLQMSLL